MALQSNLSVLRPILESDLNILLNWRNSERVRTNMYNDNIITMQEHTNWFLSEQNSSTNKHLIFEYDGRPLGTVNLTKIDYKNNKCYWGFYIGEIDAPKGSGLAMGILALDFVFKSLDMHKLCSEAFAFNKASINYHLKLGFNVEGYFKDHFFRQAKFEDIVCFAHFRDTWRTTRKLIIQQCFEGGEQNA
ncbi:UDP-4-amino-4,6-dideoxy-N-acetyl-beta-L-altrosamine N-acetyltransferase [Dendrosporobacter sp. 1207_IL3150]|uniref:UDP-4-amino-4, 6-dideoxy-N-acetyl-beta-L-altrosamine N-acetyltransferase n=1 Tax=Dendrosporobacter sp. 1207_IL3150 TaxID=3084054 RepID=UPI002FD89021